MIDISKENAIFEVQSAPKKGRAAKEVANLDELNLHIIDYELLTVPVEELESFTMDPQNLVKSLQLKKNLAIEAKEKLKCFLCGNLDIFVWEHNNMICIDQTLVVTI